jgi:hypothetical protein
VAVPAAGEAVSAATVEATEGSGGRAHLDVSVPAPVPRARALEVLGPRRASWIGGEIGSDGPAPQDMERHLIDLRMRVGEQARLVTFHKAAYLDLGSVTEAEGEIRVEISWRAAGLALLFPVFSGHLSWARDTLRVTGVYEPPGGGVGVIADRLLFNVAARGTARWLLERIARVMAGGAADEAG